jgi:bifunctional non-homologous end joining protein LigD
MSLREYQRKRHFKRTPEPGPKVAKRTGWSFVVQKHAASHLHYDFRLELDGVLKSWAVPKGPSLDPAKKRLAMHVEDHPVKYGEFEGTIPEGEYGGGTVMLWDRGSWEPLDDAQEGYRTGKLKFILHGEKLQGGWMLVRASRQRSEKGNEWFLIKERDDAAKSSDGFDVTQEMSLSTISGRTLEEIAAAKDRVWKSNRSQQGAARSVLARKPKRAAKLKLPSLAKLPGAKPGKLPRKIEAQLATLVKEAPVGDAWMHEIKFDGYRMLCRIDDGKAEIFSRNQKTWTKALPRLAEVAAALPIRQAILDGEVVAMKSDGTTDFQSLQNAFSEGRVGELLYYAFDLLYANGIDLRGVALDERKQVLAQVLEAARNQSMIRLSEHVIGNGLEFFAQAGRLGLEGIICKQRNRPYTSGRGYDWLKVKCIHSEEFVIGGFTDPGIRGGFGALLLGYHNGDPKLLYAGKVGTGFTDRLLLDLRGKLDALRQLESPFKDLRGTTGEARGAHWVRPQLVAQVAFSNWTEGGHLRHPSFLGLREDKPASMVVREAAASTKAVESAVGKGGKLQAKNNPLRCRQENPAGKTGEQR